MRLFFIASLLLLLAAPAEALSPKSRDLMQKHLESRGRITYAVYAPPMGADTAVAVIEAAGATRLYAARMNAKDGFDTVLDEPCSVVAGRPPFLLLAGGRHLLTYDAPASAPQQPLPGNLKIRDLLAAPGTKPLFELRGVTGLNFEAAEDKLGGALLWQPLQHFLNTPDMLPVKYVYCMLRPSGSGDSYVLRHHLAVLEAAQADEGIRLNNYGVLLYRTGGLKRAAEAFDDAAIFASYEQSKILRNHQLVSRESYQLSQQRDSQSGLPFSEARQYFWQGEFEACLGALAGHDTNTMTPSELAMLAISLAQENRWPEADQFLPGLARTPREFFADCQAELAWIAFYQGHMDIMARHLKSLEQIDRSHPGLVSALAAVTIRAGDKDSARRMLEQYLASPGSAGRDLAGPRLRLFSLYFERGDQTGCNALIEAAGTPPLMDLATYVDLVDYTSFELALKAAETKASEEAIEGPALPLDSLGFQEGVA